MVIELDGGTWQDGYPKTDESVDAMLAVAAREVDETWLSDWIRARIDFEAEAADGEEQET